MDFSVQTISSQLKDSYKIILLIFTAAITIQLSAEIPFEIFESDIIIRTSIVILPLTVAVSGFVVSKMYGGSKVFGVSYFLLGLGYFAVFLGESVYFFIIDPQPNSEYSIIAELFFLISPGFVLAHIIINIRYFAEKLEDYQKLLLIIIPTITILLYSLLVNISQPEDISDFYFNLIFVSGSALMVGFTVVAFTIFRQTALFAPWFLILIGILIGTAGDTVYRYAYTLGFYDFENASTSLWLASYMTIVYALYKHKQSI